MLCIIVYTFEKITFPCCFSIDIYRFGKMQPLTSTSPMMIITNNLDSYNQATALNYPNSIHNKHSAFSGDLNNNFIESFNKTSYKIKKGFKNFESAVALITTFIYHYNFLHKHSSLNNLTLA